MNEQDQQLWDQVYALIRDMDELVRSEAYAEIESKLAEIDPTLEIPVRIGALRVTFRTRERYLDTWRTVRDQIVVDLEARHIDVNKLLVGLLDEG